MLSDWLADPELPYAPASVTVDGFVHCCSSTQALLAIVSRCHRHKPGPLVALGIDEEKLDSPVERVAPPPGSPLAQLPGTLLVRVRGPVNRSAVVTVRDIVRDHEGRARDLVARELPPTR